MGLDNSRGWARRCGLLVAAVGLIVLVVGWWAGVEWIRSVLPGFPTLKANTALGFILLGSSLALFSSDRPRHRTVSTTLAGLAVLLSLVTLAETLWGNVGIDQLLAYDSGNSAAPGRPSTHTAISFLLSGLALIALNTKGRSSARVFAMLFVALATSTTLAAMVYIYGTGFLNSDMSGTGVALPTMLGMLALTIGIAIAGADRKPMSMFLKDTAGGAMLRRLLPGVVLLVLTLGYLRQMTAQSELLNVRVGISLFGLSMLITTAIAIFFAARQLDARVERDASRLRAVIDATHEAYVAIDDAGVIIEWNPAAKRTFGWTRGEAVGRKLADLLAPKQLRDFYRDGIRDLSADERGGILGQRLELDAIDRTGRTIPVELTVTAVESEVGPTFSAFLLDITERKELESQRERQLDSANAAALTDELTGLPNRRALGEFLEAAVPPSQADIDVDTSTWLAMLDLDRFKQYNDTQGHPAGDRMLRESAAAWRGALRGTDFLSRHGGEEFIVVLPRISEAAARLTIERLRGRTAQNQTCSAGIARWEVGDSTAVLVDRADRALYAAKEGGRDRSVLVTFQSPPPATDTGALHG